MYNDINNDINTQICIICLEDIEENTTFNKTICNNCDIVAHKECLDKWFKEKNEHICPICRKSNKYETNINDNIDNNIDNGWILFNICKYITFILIISFIYLIFVHK